MFPKVPCIEPFLFLLYINGLLVKLKRECELFADDTSLFAFVHDANISHNDLNSDLRKIYEGVYQWKIKFNPDTLFKLFISNL